MAKIYMALLGTTNYEETTYCYDDLQCKSCYIQEALLDMLKRKNEIYDRIIFFLTDEAKDKHWKKLKERIAELYPDDKIQTPSRIEYNESRAGLLELFHTMYDAMEKGDNVTFDITHSFRSMPALFFPLMSYAKEMKQITVDHIFYGAYDKGKPLNSVLDMKIYENIMSCSNAAHSFIRTGNASEIRDTVHSLQNNAPVNERKTFCRTVKAADCLSDLSTYLLLCLSGEHGKNSISAQAKRVRNAEQALKNYQIEQKTKELSDYEKETAFFDELIDHVLDSVREVSADQSFSAEGLAAVRWYLDKGHIMQGYSALRETIITFLCEFYAPSYDCQLIEVRGAIEAALCALNEQSKGSNAKKRPSDFLPKVEAYFPIFMKVYRHIEGQDVNFVNDLLNRRNIMDHFGMNKDTNAKPDAEFLKKCYQKAIALFDDITSRKDEILSDDEAKEELEKLIRTEQTGLFVNFSNHPSSNWDESQKQAAAALCETDSIVDIPFPRVSPDMDEEALRQLAEECLNRITELNPAVVMCMGEFGLCYQVVNALKMLRIPVVYSCTERVASEKNTANGIEKTSVFRFRRFRNY